MPRSVARYHQSLESLGALQYVTLVTYRHRACMSCVVC